MKAFVLFVISSILVVAGFTLASVTPTLLAANSHSKPIQVASAAGIEANAPLVYSTKPNTPIVTPPATAAPIVTATPSATPTAQITTTVDIFARYEAASTPTNATPTALATKIAQPTPAATAKPVVVSEVRGASSAPIPILMYHYIRVNPNPKDQLGFGLSVTPADFEAQMKHMAQLGYRSISLADLDNPANHDGKTFVLTFDDGYADFYEVAVPIMQRHGFKGTCYIITGLVGFPSFMSWVQVVDMPKQGMIVGSHSINHPDLTTLKAGELRHEVAESRSILEKMGLPVADFCYPSGRYDRDVIAAVREAGYKTAVTTKGGQYTGEDHLALTRVRIQGGMTLSEFAAAVTPGKRPQ